MITMRYIILPNRAVRPVFPLQVRQLPKSETWFVPPHIPCMIFLLLINFFKNMGIISTCLWYNTVSGEIRIHSAPYSEENPYKEETLWKPLQT